MFKAAVRLPYAFLSHSEQHVRRTSVSPFIFFLENMPLCCDREVPASVSQINTEATPPYTLDMHMHMGSYME